MAFSVKSWKPAALGLGLSCMVITLAAAQPKPELKKVERSVNAMGTVFTIDMYGTNVGQMQAASSKPSTK